MAVPSSSPAAAVWHDEGEVDPRWPAPSAPVPRQVSPTLVVVGVLLVLVLLVAGLWAGGGFARRTDRLTPTPVGTLVTAGPFQLRFTGATAQQRTSYDGRVTWRLTVLGEGRTTGEETMAPPHDGTDGMFVSRDDASGEIQEPDGLTFARDDGPGGQGFTPGLPLQPFQVQFTYGSTYRPGATLTFAALGLELRDTSLVGDQDPVWASTDDGDRFALPVRVLPAAVS